ncbi:hypothetical protein F2Q69_00037080 [Brassica cretica]|uniref:Uncharacterized protein n=1 Tax=Brassica cretica TaxID=69181 RepID=A0A8S9SNA9_BRACR|nr:hypothetical protein F2Q69_00037080 [Brassica cretica]
MIRVLGYRFRFLHVIRLGFDNYLKPPIGLNGPPIEQEKISNRNLLRSSVEQAEIGIAVSNRLRSDRRFTIGMKVHDQGIKVLAV